MPQQTYNLTDTLTDFSNGEIKNDLDQLENTIRAAAASFRGSGAPAGDGIENGAIWYKNSETNSLLNRLVLRVDGGFGDEDFNLWPYIGALSANEFTNTDSPVTVEGERLVGADTSTGEITFTISSAHIAQDGRTVQIVDTGGNASVNNITIQTEGSETISGESSLTIERDFDVVELVSDGSNLFIFRKLKNIPQFTVKTISSDSNTDGTDFYILDTSSNTVTLTIQDSEDSEGNEIKVKREGSQDATIDGAGTTTVEGGSHTISSDEGAVNLVYDATSDDWKITSSH